MRFALASPSPRACALPAALALSLAACGGGGGGGAPLVPGDPIGPTHAGQYHLGPVDFEETAFHNACAPYPSAIRSLTGDMIAGVSDEIAAPGSLCDACIEVTTDLGHTAILRVVTYGVSNAPGDLDLSPEAFEALTEGEYPRSMSWRLVACDNGAPLYVQWNAQSNPWWSSLWVRNPSMAIDRVEVRSANHTDWYRLERGTDGSFTDAGGFGEGPFTLRVVGVTGATLEIPFEGMSPGALVAAEGNLPLD